MRLKLGFRPGSVPGLGVPVIKHVRPVFGRCRFNRKELELTQSELNAAVEYFNQLKPQCLDNGLSYAEPCACMTGLRRLALRGVDVEVLGLPKCPAEPWISAESVWDEPENPDRTGQAHEMSSYSLQLLLRSRAAR